MKLLAYLYKLSPKCANSIMATWSSSEVMKEKVKFNDVVSFEDVCGQVTTSL